MNGLFVMLVLGGSLFAQQQSQRPQRIATAAHGPSSSYLGVGVVEVDSDRASALHLKEQRGVEVKNVDAESPAAKAGVKEGDVILDYNGQRIEGLAQFVRMVGETPAGHKAALGIFRNGATQLLTATIATHTAQNYSFSFDAPMAPLPPLPPVPHVDFVMPDIPFGPGAMQSSSLGYTGESIDGQLADYFGVKDGVLVRSVVKKSPADKAGLKAGDVIARVDGTAVKSPREVTAVVRRARDKKILNFSIVRNKKDMTLEVAPASEWSSRRRLESLVL